MIGVEKSNQGGFNILVEAVWRKRNKTWSCTSLVQREYVDGYYITIHYSLVLNIRRVGSWLAVGSTPAYCCYCFVSCNSNHRQGFGLRAAAAEKPAEDRATTTSTRKSLRRFIRYQIDTIPPGLHHVNFRPPSRYGGGVFLVYRWCMSPMLENPQLPRQRFASDTLKTWRYS